MYLTVDLHDDKNLNDNLSNKNLSRTQEHLT